MTSTTTLVPPHNLEAERSVLGAILLTGQQALEPIALEDHLQPEHFYREQHALVYQAMLALSQRHEPIDTLTVCAQLTQRGVLERAGGSLAVDELAGWVPAAGHARSYARIVRDLATRRSLLTACYQIQQQALEGHGSIDELLADASKRVGDLLDHSLPLGSRHMHEILFDRAAELHRFAKDPNAMIGLQTGHPQLDRALKGMRAGELIILAARPSQGKSVLGQQIATHNTSPDTARSCSRSKCQKPSSPTATSPPKPAPHTERSAPPTSPTQTSTGSPPKQPAGRATPRRWSSASTHH